jgi:pyrimidine-nucleoside phosphorylase
LEAIPGFCTELSYKDFVGAVKKTGAAIVGQSRSLAPADKLLYALRDVTATVDSLPLIASSIMGKKLAANDDCIVLDVKTGSGAFMKAYEDSIALARTMVDIGRRAGKKTVALITDMDAPLGYAIGNALEVYEAIEVLHGRGPRDLTLLCEALASQMVSLATDKSVAEALEDVRRVIASGEAFEAFVRMAEAQGGDGRYLRDAERLLQAPVKRAVLSRATGYIQRMDTEACGTASLLLGAGRNRVEDRIDPWAGIYLHAKTGEYVEKGACIATLYTSSAALLDRAEETLLGALEFGEEKPTARELILKIV